MVNGPKLPGPSLLRGTFRPTHPCGTNATLWRCPKSHCARTRWCRRAQGSAGAASRRFCRTSLAPHPSTTTHKEKGTHSGPFFFMAGGLGLLRTSMCSAPSGPVPLRATVPVCSRQTGRTRGSHPSPRQIITRKGPKGPFLVMAGGLGLLRTSMCSAPSGPVPLRATVPVCSRQTGRTRGSHPSPRQIITRKGPKGPFLVMAGGLGFEPRLVESESTVLPLDDPPRSGRL